MALGAIGFIILGGLGALVGSAFLAVAGVMCLFFTFLAYSIAVTFELVAEADTTEGPYRPDFGPRDSTLPAVARLAAVRVGEVPSAVGGGYDTIARV